MTREEIKRLYDKERDYQKTVYGDYRQNESLNLASFLQFIKHYTDKAGDAYVKKWTNDLPPWLKNCVESSAQGTAPVGTYDCVIIIMALAGAILESYTSIDVDEWRK